MSTEKQPQAPAATETAATPPPAELDRLLTQPRRELDLFDGGQFASALALAQQLSTATGFTPKLFLGNPGACLAIVTLAHAWRISPFSLAACCAEVPPGSGKLCIGATAIQAGIERSGAIAGRLTFTPIGDWSKIQGKFVMRDGRRQDENGQAKQYAAPAWNVADEEGLAIDVTGTPASGTEPVTVRCYLKACQPRNSTLWATDPETQCRYRATRNWARLVTPAVMLGATAADEYEPDADPPPPPAAQATTAPPSTAAATKASSGGALAAAGITTAANSAAHSLDLL